MSKKLVEMTGIVKQFAGVLALDHVDFELNSGEVMALLGENGAGKSTLMKILSGVYQRDAGQVVVDGVTEDSLTPLSARDKGIAMIHQELNLCGHLTVEENIFLGQEKNSAGILKKSEMRKRTLEVLKRLHLKISPDTIVGNLAVSVQQMIEIAKALTFDAKVIIMDEPTSALSNEETENLFKIVKQLNSEGVGIVYISHRLAELAHIAHRVTIMRDGKLIRVANFSEITQHEIIRDMVGREITEQFPHVECEVGETIFEVKNLNLKPNVKDVSIYVQRGEIVALAGLMGAGRTETTRAIFGADKKESGEIYIRGQEVKIDKPIDAIDQGLVLVPEDRRQDGLLIRMAVRDNIALPNLDSISNNLKVVNNRQEKKLVNQVISDLRIKTPSGETKAANLSGGNQQKIVVGKWLARNSEVIIFDEPTRGIDVAAKVEIYNIMNQLKQNGKAVLFVSSELPEVLGMADRIYVMCEGRVTGELKRHEATQESIMELATQFEEKRLKSNIG